MVDVELTDSGGYAKRDAAMAMLERCVSGRATLGVDRADDTRDLVWALRGLGVTPHVAKNEIGWRSAINGRTTWHPG